MSSSEVEEVDELLDFSGSEYEPSSSGEESDVSSLEPSENQDSDDDSAQKKRKRTRDSNKRRAKLQRQNRAHRNDAAPSSSTSTGSIQFKPFNEFMLGVTFAMSGFVNPLRSELRSKALEMGAKYKPDWDLTCTHLICAFKNTPKYNQVKGIGKVVKKEWIENCYSSRKRFPWRRYALNWRDSNKNESEDEVHELIPDTPLDSLTNSTTSIFNENNSRNIESSPNENLEDRITSNISSTNDVCPDTSLSFESKDEYRDLECNQQEKDLVSSTTVSEINC